MKKVIIGMLLLLPLIIVASVLFAIDVITVEAYIAIERVELNHTTLELDLSVGTYDGLEATVYPTGARNKDIIWTITDIVQTIEYEGDIADIDEKSGVLELHSYGTFTVVATTAEGNKKAACLVYVKGDKIKSITLPEEPSKMTVGEEVKLDAVFYPVDAIVKNITWTSSDGSVLRVDANGILTAVSEGSATITVGTDDGVSAQTTITVEKGLTKYGNKFNVALNEINLDDIEFTETITGAVYGGTLSGRVLTFTSGTITLPTAKGNLEISKCEETDIEIEHFGILDRTELRVGKLPLVLKAVYKDVRYRFTEIEAVWSSSDTEVAEINGSGVINAKRNGIVTFTAEYNGKVAQSITIEVVKPVSLIVLDKNPATEKRGIKGETVYGNKRYGANGLENMVLEVGIVFPSDAVLEEDFIFTVNDPSLATFTAPGKLVLIGDFKGGKEVTVRVTAKISPYVSVPVYKEYTFKVFDGVNCYNYNDMRRAVDDGRDVYLHDNIDYGANGRTFELKSNVYGNGYMLDGLNYVNKTQDYTMLLITANNVTVSNLQVRSDEASRIFMPNGLRGYCLAIGKQDGAFIRGVNIEYCILENAYYCAVGHNAEYTVMGSIMRNTSNFGLFVPSGKKTDGISYYSEVTLINNVMSNIVAPAIGVSSESKDCPVSKLTVKGFLDIYNWQQIDSMRLIDRELVEGQDALNEVLKSALKNILSREFAKSQYDHIRFEKNGVNYLHLGIITAGALYPGNAEVIVEDPRLIEFDIAVLHDKSVLPISLEPCILYCYGNTAGIQPGDMPAEDELLYSRLRGE